MPPRFTPSELQMISQLLQVARESLYETLRDVQYQYPGSALAGSLQSWIEQSADLEERIGKPGRTFRPIERVG